MPIHLSLSFRHAGQKTAVLKGSPWPYRDVGELIALKNCIFDILLFCRFLLRPYGLPDLISLLMIPRFVHLSLPWSLQREDNHACVLARFVWQASAGRPVYF
jgi:hypothetical protein